MIQKPTVQKQMEFYEELRRVCELCHIPVPKVTTELFYHYYSEYNVSLLKFDFMKLVYYHNILKYRSVPEGMEYVCDLTEEEREYMDSLSFINVIYPICMNIFHSGIMDKICENLHDLVCNHRDDIINPIQKIYNTLYRTFISAEDIRRACKYMDAIHKSVTYDEATHVSMLPYINCIIDEDPDIIVDCLHDDPDIDEIAERLADISGDLHYILSLARTDSADTTKEVMLEYIWFLISGAKNPSISSYIHEAKLMRSSIDVMMRLFDITDPFINDKIIIGSDEINSSLTNIIRAGMWIENVSRADMINNFDAVVKNLRTLYNQNLGCIVRFREFMIYNITYVNELGMIFRKFKEYFEKYYTESYTSESGYVARDPEEDADLYPYEESFFKQYSMKSFVNVFTYTDPYQGFNIEMRIPLEKIICEFDKFEKKKAEEESPKESQYDMMPDDVTNVD